MNWCGASWRRIVAGRLFQVEYAMEAISNGAACVGVLAEDGVVIATQKVVVSKLLAPPKSSEKIYKIDEHVFCAVAGAWRRVQPQRLCDCVCCLCTHASRYVCTPGLTSDANILIDLARRVAQNHRYTYGKEAPVENIVTRVCDVKQGQTQFGGTLSEWCGRRALPHDHLINVCAVQAFAHTVCLSSSEAGTNTASSSCTTAIPVATSGDGKRPPLAPTSRCVSASACVWLAVLWLRQHPLMLPLFLLQSAQSNLKSEYKDGMDTEAALELGVKVLMKTIDSAAPTSENMELATLTVKDGRVVQSILAADKVNALIKKVIDGEAASGDV